MSRNREREREREREIYIYMHIVFPSGVECLMGIQRLYNKRLTGTKDKCKHIIRVLKDKC